MLGRLTSARMKMAEQAVHAGRLDEAFRMASAEDLAGQARVQKVLKELGDRFFERAEQHYHAGRHTEAMQDLVKAAQADGEQPRISDMMAIVQAAGDQAAVERRERRQRVADAEDRIAAGSLRAARAILARAGDSDAEANRLRDHIEDRSAKAGAALEQAREHAAKKRWSAAVERFRVARSLEPKSDRTAECEKSLVESILEQVRASINSGQLARGLEELRLLSGIGDGLVTKDEGRVILRQLEAAGLALRESRYEQARRALLPLQQVLPKAGWIKATCNQLKNLDELVTQLYAGPLGLVFAGLDEAPTTAPTTAPDAVAAPAKPHAQLAETLAGSWDPAPGQLPDRLLLWVDGAGSYLMMRGRNASIGRAAARKPADIPLISDLSEHHADLQRVEEDYFLTAARAVNVGGRDVKQALLQDGDRIILGRRAKLVFKLPSRKCTSAVLDLVGSARMPNDVRRVILFDRLLTISRSRQAHIQVPTAEESLVLFERDGQLWMRPQAGGPEAVAVPVTFGKSMEFAGVSLVIEPWTRKQDELHV